MPYKVHGPLRMKAKGSLTREIHKIVSETGVKVKLPFAADGFECTKLPKDIEIDTATAEGEKAKKVKSIK